MAKTGSLKEDKYSTISLNQAKTMKSCRKRKSPALDLYKKYIIELNLNEAGKIILENDKEGFAVRALLKRASEALGIGITVKKVNDYILFWK